jgi:O-antigen/teichoic acid export membrane protein
MKFISNSKKNSIFGIFYNAINLIFPLILVHLIFYFWGKQFYANYLSNVLPMQALIAIFSLSFQAPFLREFSYSKKFKVIIFNSLLRYQVLLITTAGGIYFLYEFLFGNEFGFDNFIILVIIFTFSLNVDWFYFSRRLMSSLFYRNLIVKALQITILYMMAILGVSANFVLLVLYVSPAFLNIASFVRVKKIFNLKYFFCDLKISIKHIFAYRYFFVSGLVGSSYQYIDQILLSKIADFNFLAEYNFFKIFSAAAVSFSAIYTKSIMSSVMSTESKDRRKVIRAAFKYSLLISFFICVLYFIFLQLFIEILTSGSIVVDNFFILNVAIYFSVTSLIVFISNLILIPNSLERINLIGNFISLFFLMVFWLFIRIKNMDDNYYFFALIFSEIVNLIYIFYCIFSDKNLRFRIFCN